MCVQCCCTLRMWLKVSQSSWMKELSHKLQPGSGACSFPRVLSRWLSSYGEIEAKTRSVAVTWRWQRIGDKHWLPPSHSLLFIWLTQWMHLAQAPDDTPTPNWVTVISINRVFIVLWSVAMPLQGFKLSKYNFLKKNALNNWKWQYKFNQLYSGIKIVFASVNVLVTEERSAGIPHWSPSALPVMVDWCCHKRVW